MEGTVTELPVVRPSQVTPVSSPWGKKVEVIPCSLEDVMSEDLAAKLQKEEENSYIAPNDDADPEILQLIESVEAGTLVNAETDSDVALARMLQMQFDREHNQFLMAQERKINGTNKVSISFNNYRSEHPVLDDEDEDECLYNDDADEHAKSEWDQDVPSFNTQGYSGKGKNITTKHDLTICGQRNASKLMDFPPEFESGDGEGMNMQLPNHVYNKLKRHSEAESKRGQRLHEKKEHSTAEQAMDPRTRLLLYKMVNNGTLDSISGSISTGKESVVFHAFGGEYKEQQMDEEVAIKVFKTTLNEFKTREKYVHGDYRFTQDSYKKKNPRKIIKIWAFKEAANLNRMRRANIPCPTVQVQKDHVLVMSFIGSNQEPAPKLKDAKLSSVDAEDAYQQVKQIMKKMYKDCSLVHADLSEFNMLWYKERVWIIDVSQAVDITHPYSLDFLYRDCQNVSNFFKKCGVHNVASAEELFNKITKLNVHGQGSEFTSQLQKFNKEKDEEMLANQMSDKSYAFDFFFEKSMKERDPDFNKLDIPDSDSEEDIGDDNVDKVDEVKDSDTKESKEEDEVRTDSDKEKLPSTKEMSQ